MWLRNRSQFPHDIAFFGGSLASPRESDTIAVLLMRSNVWVLEQWRLSDTDCLLQDPTTEWLPWRGTRFQQLQASQESGPRAAGFGELENDTTTN